jgi:hypothetical protein
MECKIEIAEKEKERKKKPITHSHKKKATGKKKIVEEPDCVEYDYDNSDQSDGYMQDTEPVHKHPSLKYDKEVGISVNQLALFIIASVANKAFNIGFHVNEGRERVTCMCPLSGKSFKHWRKYAKITFLDEKSHCKNHCMTSDAFFQHASESCQGCWYHISIVYFLRFLYCDYWRKNIHHPDTYRKTNTAQAKMAKQDETRFFYKHKSKIKNAAKVIFCGKHGKELEDENEKGSENKTSEDENMTVFNAAHDVDTILENNRNILDTNNHWFTNQDTINTITRNARGENRNNQNISSFLLNRSSRTNENFGYNYTPSFTSSQSSTNHNRNDYNNNFSRNYQNHTRCHGRGTYRGVQGGRGRGRSYMNSDDSRNNNYYSDHDYSQRGRSIGMGRVTNFQPNNRRGVARGHVRGGGRNFGRTSGRMSGRHFGQGRGRGRFNSSHGRFNKYGPSITNYNNMLNESDINHYTNRSLQQSTLHREEQYNDTASFDIDNDETKTKSPNRKNIDDKQKSRENVENEKDASSATPSIPMRQQNLQSNDRNISLDDSISVCTGNTGSSSIKRKQSEMESSQNDTSPAKILRPEVQTEIGRCIGEPVVSSLREKEKQECRILKEFLSAKATLKPACSFIVFV